MRGMTRAEYVFGFSICFAAAGLGTAAYIWAGGHNMEVPALFFGIVIVGGLVSLVLRAMLGLFK